MRPLNGDPMAKKKKTSGNLAAQNRRARHDYAISETFEAGIVLAGSEVKSLRAGEATITESYASFEDGELYLINSYIPEYKSAAHFGHEARRRRKLLLHKKEMAKLTAAIERKGMTLVPLDIHFNPRGIAKVTLGLGQGKKTHDKRQDIKERDWKRQKARVLRDRG